MRFSLPGGEALVLAVQSKEQAQRWLKVPLLPSLKLLSQTRAGEVNVLFLCDQVVQEVGSQCSNTEGLDGSTSPIIQRKLELDKVFVL